MDAQQAIDVIQCVREPLGRHRKLGGKNKELLNSLDRMLHYLKVIASSEMKDEEDGNRQATNFLAEFECAQSWAYETILEKQKCPNKTERKRVIADALIHAEKLEECLTFFDRDLARDINLYVEHPELIFTSNPWFNNIKISLPRLITLLKEASTFAEGLPDLKSGRKRNSPRINYIGMLADIWESYFGKKAGISRDSEGKTPGGPFFRFVAACFQQEELPSSEKNLADETIATSIRKALDARAAYRKWASSSA